ncbi:TIGR04282 family arsenosugar biosynthesis glycosyltransferase [Celeribacter sp. PS-C1]|uniref:TIGR04282 family arsenosugar biosynthesis glycosyltransferase n=1 Tax=Celeribacter sp. PS-C1 TaxID=2820813 RepID=UPI001CA4DD84|nr:TIGR04282 family arsenosugar biosynthesis glycosyltransferase [Celeribacter sp. PS-C1]MBW6416407.1 TIGR04282 family arsenosugar biosynthesis glycosyltransferase [Celeribacter sp. PS-C1]
MVKEPRAGRVKTRLARDLGLIRATWWYRHQALKTLRTLNDPRWDTVLAVAPDREGVQSAFWPRHLPRIPQGTGDLGQRMSRVMRQIGPRPTCLIGSDIPGIEKSHIVSAFASLGTHSACIGPATDGGYWLIGLRHPTRQPAGFLGKVRWSTQWAKADTIASAKSLNWAELETLSDIDTGADYARWQARI